jgi:CRISPR-associated protein Cas2
VKKGKINKSDTGVSQPESRGRRSGRHFVVVSYDIPDDRRRTKVCHLLKDYGQRVQYSVFECQLRPKDFKRLRERLRPLLDLAEDDVRFYRLCQVCLPKAKIWGPSPRQGVRESIVV